MNVAGAARHSINRKLSLTVLFTTGASLMLACMVFIAYDVISLRNSMAQDAGTLARVIGINSAVALTFEDSAAATETLGALAAAESVLAAVIYDGEGAVFSSYVSSRNAASSFSPPPRTSAGHTFEARHLDLT
ncbi:MAG: CHASE sensor domain-containing protein, partial [Longimicrobiales bacterium]